MSESMTPELDEQITAKEVELQGLANSLRRTSSAVPSDWMAAMDGMEPDTLESIENYCLSLRELKALEAERDGKGATT